MRCSIVSRLSLLPRRVGNSGASARRRVRRASPAGRRSCRWSRGDPVFASFAVAGDVCARPEVDVTAGEPCQFGGPQPSLHGECQQRVVTPPGPARQVAAGEQRVNLGLGEVVINARSKPSSRGKQVSCLTVTSSNATMTPLDSRPCPGGGSWSEPSRGSPNTGAVSATM